MGIIDINAIQSRFDSTVSNFGTTFSTFLTDDFVERNSFILQDINSNKIQVHLTVTTFEDQNDGNASNGLSIRDAILIAQRDPSNEYIINVPTGFYELTIQGNEDYRFQEVSTENLGLFDDYVLRSGDLDITSNVTIIGDNPLTTVINATQLGDRIFDVKANGLLNLQNITIQNGLTQGTFGKDGFAPSVDPTSDPALEPESFSGAGIRIDVGATATITNSIIRSNKAQWDKRTKEAQIDGGGIFNKGVLELTNSLVADNIADANGGGIYNEGTLQIKNSSINDNTANNTLFYVNKIEGGGGIQNSGTGTMNIYNSTVSGNITTASGNDLASTEPSLGIFPEGAGGGGILSNGGQVVIVNSTIVNNTAPTGSGILIDAQVETNTLIPAVLQNSIVASNLRLNVVDDSVSVGGDVDGFFELNSSNNLIGNGNGILFDGIENNLVGTFSNPLDPKLTTLQTTASGIPFYGLQADSPAIDRGDNTLAVPVGATDQRGSSRIVNGTVDMGSSEFIAQNDSLNNPIFRFQNTALPGSYLFVGEEERQNILRNYPTFKEEGFAFNVASAPGDSLQPIYRFQNTVFSGTYIYVGEEERQNIKQNQRNFVEEGLAFYVLPAGSGEGQTIYRFQNKDLPGTYLFAGEGERSIINENYSRTFVEEGATFDVQI